METATALFESGGIMMYPLLFSALIAIVIIFERIGAIKENKILKPELVPAEDLPHSLIHHF